MGKCKHPDCIYRSMATDTCDYAFMTGTRRPCPAGDCKGVYRSIRTKSKKGPPLSFDEEKAIEMFVAGYSDKEIADVVGVERRTICNWRNRRRLNIMRSESESVNT